MPGSQTLRIALCARYAWPAKGGIEAKVRTIAASLAAQDEVGVFAHRVDGRLKPMWALDRVKPFAPFMDPESGVVTHQLRLRRSDVARLAPCLPAMLLCDFGQRRLPRSVIERALLGPERWAAAVSAGRFAEQFAAPDIVHRFGGNRMALATVDAGRRLGVPVVISPSAHPGQWDDDPISLRAYQGADLIVASCHTDAQTYLDLGVAPARVAICPEPSNEIRIGGAEALRNRLGIHGTLIVYVGARRGYKGFDLLLSAAERLAVTHPEVRVAFVGPGQPLDANLPNVHDIGEVDDDERDAWYDAADVLVLPSAFESWGLVISEAWSASTPVVTSDIPVLRERVEAAGGGLAVPREPSALVQALAILIEDPERRRSMGAAGRREWESHLAPEQVARWHRDTYAELIDRR